MLKLLLLANNKLGNALPVVVVRANEGFYQIPNKLLLSGLAL
jgi:hypothetical protein